jgi:hypothetical protein
MNRKMTDITRFQWQKTSDQLAKYKQQLNGHEVLLPLF